MKSVKPWYLQALAVFYVLLSVLELLEVSSLFRDAALVDRAALVVRFSLVAIVLGVSGGLLLKGHPWGYLLGLLIPGYWLWMGARVLRYQIPPHGLWVRPGAVAYLVFGIAALAALLAPRSRRWFERSWRSRAETTA